MFRPLSAAILRRPQTHQNTGVIDPKYSTDNTWEIVHH